MPAASRILLFRPGAIGDLLCTLPAFARIRSLFPEASFHLAARPDCLSLLRGRVPGIASVSSIDEARWALFYAPLPDESMERETRAARLRQRLGDGNFDAAFLWSNDPRELCDAFRLAGIPQVYTTPARPPEDCNRRAVFLFCEFVPCASANPDETREAIAPSIDEPEGFAFAGASEAPARYPTESLLELSDANRERGRQLLEQSSIARDSNHLLLLAPGAGGAAKQAPPELFAHAAEFWSEQGGRIAWLCGPADETAVRAAQSELQSLSSKESSQAEPIEAAPQDAPTILRPADLQELACILGAATALLANDSGPAHLASALGVPTLAWFVASDPAVWAPFGPRADFLDLRKLGQRENEARVRAWLDAL